MIHKDRYDCKNCGAVFTYDKLNIVKRDYGGIAFSESVCPFCGGREWSSFNDRNYLAKYIYPSEYADYDRR